MIDSQMREHGHGYKHAGNDALLVGRERELELLRARLDAAISGRGGLVLIGGEAGIGKTTLAELLCAEAAARGAQVLVGRCYDLTETPPYGPWLDLFAHAPRAASSSDTEDGADVPPIPVALVASEGVGELPNQAALFAPIRAFLAQRAARGPLVLFLDDLHWADHASLDLLRYLARELAALPVLLLVAYRADELTRHHPLYNLLPLLVREARAERLDLRRLRRDDVRHLVRARYPLAKADEARLVAYLQDHSEGNPFFTGELLRTLEEEQVLRPAESGWALGDLSCVGVPSLLRQVIDGRLTRLSDETQRYLAVAAVIGQELSLPLWAAVAGTTEETLLEVIEQAAAARLLEPADGDEADARFVHALIREALYEGLLPPRRRMWHRRVAEALAETPRPDPDVVASHFQRAGDGRAIDWLLRAGERAQRSYALLTAAERFEAALTIMESQDCDPARCARLLYRLARMRRYADPHGAISYLDDAEAQATDAADLLLRAYIICCRGHLRCTAGQIERGLAEMVDGFAAFDALPSDEQARLSTLQEELGDPADQQHYRGTFATWLALAGRYRESLAQSERVIAGYEACGADLIGGPAFSGFANAHRGLAHAYAALGRPAEARRAYDLARTRYREDEHWYQVGNTLASELYEVVLPYHADDLDDRSCLAAEAERAWDRASGALDDLPPSLARLPLLLLEGHWTEARELALAARAPGRRTHWRPYATGLLARLARDRGETELAWSLVRERLEDGPECEPGNTIIFDALQLQRLAAALALDAADLPAARAWLAAHDRWLDWSEGVLGRAESRLLWARYHQIAGDPAEAHRQAEAGVRLAEEPRQPLVLLAAYRLLGRLATAAGRHDEATEQLDQALNLAHACAAPYERALTLIALAELCAATGDLDAAQASLDEARATCTSLGAALALTKIEALATTLAASKAAPTERATEYPAGLSAREIEVLRLVAEGLTDAQVAERLYLSPRTIGQHLRSIYGKLGVSSRTAATRFALEHSIL